MDRSQLIRAVSKVGLLICVLAFCLPANATICYTSGTFSNSVYTGPLNGGSFGGNFTVSGLPLIPNLPSSFKTLTSWDIFFWNSGGVLQFELKSGAFGAYAYADARNESVNGVDFLSFGNTNDHNLLQLNFAPGFAGGGPVVLRSPNNFISAVDAGGTASNQVSLVETGQSTIPEPSPLSMLGVAVVLIGVRFGGVKGVVQRG